MEVFFITSAFDPEVQDVLLAACEPLNPHRDETHPLGCQRPLVSDRDCFEMTLVRLATGCSWEDTEWLCGKKVSDTTERGGHDQWLEAGAFDKLGAEGLGAYDKIIELALDDVSVDTSLQKSPGEAGEPARTRPTEASSAGSGRSSPTETGSPSVAIDGANRNDSAMLVAPTFDGTKAEELLEEVKPSGLTAARARMPPDSGFSSDRSRTL